MVLGISLFSSTWAQNFDDYLVEVETIDILLPILDGFDREKLMVALEKIEEHYSVEKPQVVVVSKNIRFRLGEKVAGYLLSWWNILKSYRTWGYSDYWKVVYTSMDPVDIQSFLVLGHWFAKDKHQVFFQGYSHLITTLPEGASQYDYDGFDAVNRDVDVETFHVLNRDLARDKYGAFYVENNEHSTRVIEILESDGLSFEYIDPCFAKDKNYVYDIHSYQYLFEMHPISWANWATFKSWGEKYLHLCIGDDGERVIAAGEVLLYSDPETFVSRWWGYFVDSSSVYYIPHIHEGWRIEEADAENFDNFGTGERLGELYDARDKKHRYLNWKLCIACE